MCCIFYTCKPASHSTHDPHTHTHYCNRFSRYIHSVREFRTENHMDKLSKALLMCKPLLRWQHEQRVPHNRLLQQLQIVKLSLATKQGKHFRNDCGSINL